MHLHVSHRDNRTIQICWKAYFTTKNAFQKEYRNVILEIDIEQYCNIIKELIEHNKITLSRVSFVTCGLIKIYSCKVELYLDECQSYFSIYLEGQTKEKKKQEKPVKKTVINQDKMIDMMIHNSEIDVGVQSEAQLIELFSRCGNHTTHKSTITMPEEPLGFGRLSTAEGTTFFGDEEYLARKDIPGDSTGFSSTHLPDESEIRHSIRLPEETIIPPHLRMSEEFEIRSPERGTPRKTPKRKIVSADDSEIPIKRKSVQITSPSLDNIIEKTIEVTPVEEIELPPPTTKKTPKLKTEQQNYEGIEETAEVTGVEEIQLPPPTAKKTPKLKTKQQHYEGIARSTWKTRVTKKMDMFLFEQGFEVNETVANDSEQVFLHKEDDHIDGIPFDKIETKQTVCDDEDYSFFEHDFENGFENALVTSMSTPHFTSQWLENSCAEMFEAQIALSRELQKSTIDDRSRNISHEPEQLEESDVSPKRLDATYTLEEKMLLNDGKEPHDRTSVYDVPPNVGEEPLEPTSIHEILRHVEEEPIEPTSVINIEVTTPTKVVDEPSSVFEPPTNIVDEPTSVFETPAKVVGESIEPRFEPTFEPSFEPTHDVPTNVVEQSAAPRARVDSPSLTHDELLEEIASFLSNEGNEVTTFQKLIASPSLSHGQKNILFLRLIELENDGKIIAAQSEPYGTIEIALPHNYR